MDEDAYTLGSDDTNTDEEILEEPKKKVKLSPQAKNPKGGRPTPKAKYVFNQRDKKVMIEACKKYGSSYATIAKEYFADCSPAVTRQDVANYVKNNPLLSDLCKTGIQLT